MAVYKYKQLTIHDIKKSFEFRELIDSANKSLEVRGYTEHGLRHVGYVSHTTANILRELGYDARTVELGEIAGWIHDIGNAVNRENHGIIGASLAFPILSRMGLNPREASQIIGAIGNHEEQNGVPVNPVSAALILADKSDAHRTRVRKGSYDPTDIHDRVNYAIKKNYLVIDNNKKIVKLIIFMDNSSSTMEFFQIYLSRMLLSEKAASFLGCTFELIINNVLINNHVSKTPSLRLAKSETNVSTEVSSTGELDAHDEAKSNNEGKSGTQKPKVR